MLRQGLMKRSMHTAEVSCRPFREIRVTSASQFLCDVTAYGSVCELTAGWWCAAFSSEAKAKLNALHIQLNQTGQQGEAILKLNYLRQNNANFSQAENPEARAQTNSIGIECRLFLELLWDANFISIGFIWHSVVLKYQMTNFTFHPGAFIPCSPHFFHHTASTSW